MPDNYAEKTVINDDSLLTIVSEIEAQLEILPGTIDELQRKLSPVLKAEQDSTTNEAASDIKPISNNSIAYDRLIEILYRIRGAKSRIHEITDRVQL